MDVFDRMKRVKDRYYMDLLRELDPGLIANHMKSVLSQGGADHYEEIRLPTKTRQQQCEALLRNIMLHDKWWIHFIKALEKCGKNQLASPFKDELKRIESEDQKLTKGKRPSTENRRRSRNSLTDADLTSPPASSSPVLRCPRRRRDSDDLSSGASFYNDPTEHLARPRQTGAASYRQNLACGNNEQSVFMEQNGPVPCGKTPKRKDDIFLECGSSDDSQQAYTPDTPLRQAPGALMISLYRHLDSKTRMGNYEDLAGELGFKLEDLSTLVNTESVIQRFSQVHPKKATFRVLMEALHNIERKDVLELIEQRTRLFWHVKDQNEDRHVTSARRMNRNCERMPGKVADKCDEVPDDPGIIPSDAPRPAYCDGFSLPSNISQNDKLKFSAPAAKSSEDITIPVMKTDQDKTPGNLAIEDDLATAVHLEESVMAASYGQKLEEYDEHDKRMAADSPSEIPDNTEDGAKPPPISKVLPGYSGTGAKPKLYTTNRDHREIYLPPDDINGRPKRKQLSHGRSNGESSRSIGETVSQLRAPNCEDTEQRRQTLVPSQRKDLRQCTNIPNFDVILPTNMKSKEKVEYKEHGTSESEFVHYISLSQYSENASVHDKLAQEVLEKQLSHGRSNGESSRSIGETVSQLRAPNCEDTEQRRQTLVPSQRKDLRQCTNIPNFDAILPTNMKSKEKVEYKKHGTSESEFAHYISLSQYSENASVHDKLAQEVLEKEHLRCWYRLGVKGSDGTSTVAPDNAAIDDHGNHTRDNIGPIQTRGNIGPIQRLEWGKTPLSPCLSIDDSESESSSVH